MVQDVYLVFDSIKKVYEAGGRMVPGLANRNGHRRNKEGSSKWGGKRVKSYAIGDDTWLEPGAKAVIEEEKALTKAKYYEFFSGQ